MEQDAEREHIAAMIDPVAARLLGRHVGHRAEDDAAIGVKVGQRLGGRVADRLNQLRDAEVDDLGVALVGEHDVGGLQIAVHDLLLVRSRQARRHLRRDLEHAAHQHPLAGQRVAHLLAANQLHRDVGAPVDLADLVNDRDVRMLERGGGLRLLDEAPTPIGVVRQIVGQDLERDIAIQPRVGGAVDNAHAAAADLFSDTVVPEEASGDIHELAERILARRNLARLPLSACAKGTFCGLFPRIRRAAHDRENACRRCCCWSPRRSTPRSSASR